MRSFDILNRHQHVHQHHVLEASAGTGKTFSIEHLVVRLLVEKPKEGGLPLTLSQILIVTFTRAATRELRQRIRDKIEQAISHLTQPQKAPDDYLLAIRETGEDEIAEAKKRLEDALATYDEAQIYTIHSFCGRMLRECHESTWSTTRSAEERGPSQSRLLEVVKDFLRTGVRCSTTQLRRLLEQRNRPIDKLQQTLLKEALRPGVIAPVPSFHDQLEEFRAVMTALTRQYRWKPDKIMEDYEQTLHRYNKYGPRNPEEYKEEVRGFAALFGQDTWSAADLNQLIDTDIVWAKLDVSKRKTKQEWPATHYPDLIPILKEQLVPLIDRCRNPKHIFAALAHACQKHIKHYMSQEELSGSDQLLQQMNDAVQNISFCDRVAARYRFAIVDEFQDTDPIQWNILKKLFLEQPAHHLALVGDPKQSIYGFRAADIHTYFEAVGHLPVEHHASLSTNYRSRPELVEAVNSLFSSEHSPGLLPKGFQPVQAAKTDLNGPSDAKGAMHFFYVQTSEKKSTSTVEEEAILPYIGQEILSLQSKGYPFADMAILVSDRYQTKRVLAALTAVGIPAILERSGFVTDSPAFTGVAELLRAILRPRDRSACLQALGGILLAYTEQEASQILASSEGMRWFNTLHRILIEQGIAASFEELFRSRIGDTTHTFLQRLLRRKEGLNLDRDMRQLEGLLAEAQHSDHVQAEGLIEQLRQLRQLAADEEERVKIRDDIKRDAVRIMTIHVSKGLEFPIVFCPGIITQSKIDHSLVPSDRKKNHLVVADDTSSDAIQRFHRELDEEKVRQAYVALTRAKNRVYVPILYHSAETEKGIANGQASPLELILARFGCPPISSEEELLHRISLLRPETLTEYLDTHISPAWMTHEQISNEVCPTKTAIQATPVELMPPNPVTVQAKPIWIHSYTGITAAFTEDENVSPTIAVNAPNCSYSAIKNMHTLPAGSQTGILLHQLLQDIPFDRIDQHTVEQQLAGNQLSEWSEVVADLLQRVVNTPLLLDGVELPLISIPPDQLYKEMEFFYSLDDSNLLPFNDVGFGFMKGVIDLVFTYQDKYYLIDWKSNWLGPNESAYNQEALEAAMRANQYPLQAAIYTEALKRYLAQVDPRPFEECFGGAFYFFLR